MLQRRREEEVSAEPQKRITDSVEGGRGERKRGREEKVAEKVRKSVKRERQTQRRGHERESLDRKSEKSDMAESFCSLSLSLQMEVNVKQSLLLISGGINSLERD